MKLEEEVVVLGVDDMNFGLSGGERLWTLTVDEVGKGKGGLYLGLRLGAASCPGLKRRRWPCRVYSLRIPHLCRGDTFGWTFAIATHGAGTVPLSCDDLRCHLSLESPFPILSPVKNGQPTLRVQWFEDRKQDSQE